MDALKRTRSCNPQPQASGQAVPRGSRQVCIPMTRDVHDGIWNDAGKVRSFSTPLIQTMPEVFPPGIQAGYQLSGHLPELVKMRRCHWLSEPNGFSTTGSRPHGERSQCGAGSTHPLVSRHRRSFAAIVPAETGSRPVT